MADRTGAATSVTVRPRSGLLEPAGEPSRTRRRAGHRRHLSDPGRWHPHPSPAAVRAALRQVPDGARVATENRLAPQLTSRCTVYLFPRQPDDGTRPEWVLLTETGDTSVFSAAHNTARRAELPALGYRVVGRRAGLDLYGRDVATIPTGLKVVPTPQSGSERP